MGRDVGFRASIPRIPLADIRRHCCESPIEHPRNHSLPLFHIRRISLRILSPYGAIKLGRHVGEVEEVSRFAEVPFCNSAPKGSSSGHARCATVDRCLKHIVEKQLSILHERGVLLVSSSIVTMFGPQINPVVE